MRTIQDDALEIWLNSTALVGSWNHHPKTSILTSLSVIQCHSHLFLTNMNQIGLQKTSAPNAGIKAITCWLGFMDINNLMIIFFWYIPRERQLTPRQPNLLGSAVQYVLQNDRDNQFLLSRGKERKGTIKWKVIKSTEKFDRD